MAYTVTWVLTRPDADTVLPTIASISPDNKSESDAILDAAGVTKTYEVDGLVTRVVYTFEDKAQHDALDFSGTTDHASMRATYKQQLIDRNISLNITDSDGATIADY